jgi:hypothetical protein
MVVIAPGMSDSARGEIEIVILRLCSAGSGIGPGKSEITTVSDGTETHSYDGSPKVWVDRIE